MYSLVIGVLIALVVALLGYFCIWTPSPRTRTRILILRNNLDNHDDDGNDGDGDDGDGDDGDGDGGDDGNDGDGDDGDDGDSSFVFPYGIPPAPIDQFDDDVIEVHIISSDEDEDTNTNYDLEDTIDYTTHI